VQALPVNTHVTYIDDADLDDADHIEDALVVVSDDDDDDDLPITSKNINPGHSSLFPKMQVSTHHNKPILN